MNKGEKMSERKKDFYKLYLVLSLFIISLSAYGDNSECNSCRNRQSQICNQLHSTHNNRNLDSNRLERIQNCIVNACRSVCGTNNNPSSDNQPNQPDFTQESGFSDFNDQTGQRIQNAENLQTSSEMGQLSAGATAKKNSKLQQLGGTVAIVGAGVATYKAGVCFSAQNYPCGALWAGVAISLHKTASNLNEASQKNRDIASQWGTQDDDFSGVDGGYEDIDNTDFPCQGEECPDGTTTPGTTTPGTTTPGTTTPGTTTPGTTTPGTTTPGTTTPGTTTPGTTTPLPAPQPATQQEILPAPQEILPAPQETQPAPQIFQTLPVTQIQVIRFPHLTLHLIIIKMLHHKIWPSTRNCNNGKVLVEVVVAVNKT